MDKRPVKAQVYTWVTEDLAEYWKLIGLSLTGVSSGNGTKSHNIFFIPNLFNLFCLLIFTTEKAISIASDGDVDVFEITTECVNCCQTFSNTHFEKHICDFSDPHTLIYDDEKLNILWENSSLRKMYAENNAQIDQILKQYNEVSTRSKDAKKPTIQGNHECVVCHRIYVHASGLSRHMETQHNSVEMTQKTVQLPEIKEGTSAEVVKCLICGRIFNSLAICFSHLKSTHAEYGFDESENSLKAGDALLFGKIRVDQVYQCEFCDFLFADTSDLFQHKIEHNISTGYECSSCQLASRNLKFILNHRNNECPYEMYERNQTIACNLHFICSECEESFGSLAHLYEHRYVDSFVLHL